MLEVKKVQKKKNMFEKQVEYKEPVRLNSKAKTKEAITSKYSESYQLNVMRKAILGDAESLIELQVIEDYINSLKA